MAEASSVISWSTNIMDPKINRIIALSDIHGDMHALIVAFRDCAQIIRKKPDHINPNPEQLDLETEGLLELNLNIHEAIYQNDLNYEWCGGNTNVVICGDILDGYRVNKTNHRSSKDNNSRCPKDIKKNTTGCISTEYE